MTSDYVCSIDELEQVVGARPSGSGLKSIRFLDPHCHALLALSTLSVVGLFDPERGVTTTAVGGHAGHAAPVGPTQLALPSLAIDDVADGAPAGLLALVPGYRETLRINGRLRTDAVTRIDVEEAFLHCAKALIRSRLWDDPPAEHDGAVDTSTGSALDDATRSFLVRSPFVTLSSVDGQGCADVSPKGDPAGFVRVLDDATVAIPDRPGNKRTDTMHNLVDEPRIALLAFVPGDHRTLEIRGAARITDRASVCEPLAERGKVPAAAIVIEIEHLDLRTDPAIEKAALWDPGLHVDADALPRGAKIWTDHVKLNDDPGLANKAMRFAVNEKVMAKGIDHDYRSNLY